MGDIFEQLGVVGGVFCLDGLLVFLLLHYRAQRSLLTQLPLHRQDPGTGLISAVRRSRASGAGLFLADFLSILLNLLQPVGI